MAPAGGPNTTATRLSPLFGLCVEVFRVRRAANAGQDEFAVSRETQGLGLAKHLSHTLDMGSCIRDFDAAVIVSSSDWLNWCDSSLDYEGSCDAGHTRDFLRSIHQYLHRWLLIVGN